MARELPKTKPDYSLAIRYRKRDGQWSKKSRSDLNGMGSCAIGSEMRQEK